MSTLNLLNQPDTFGNYFQATPTPLPPISYQRTSNPVSNVLYGVKDTSSIKQNYRRKQPSRHRVVHPSRKQSNKPNDSVQRDRNNDATNVDIHEINRKKTVLPFHGRRKNTDREDITLDYNLESATEESKPKHELSYNDIYKQLSTPKIHINDKYASSNKLTQHVPVEKKVSYSGNYAIGHNSNIGNDADALDDYYNEYYDEEYTDYATNKPSSKNGYQYTNQLSNSANSETPDRKELLKRHGDPDREESNWLKTSHPETEEELRDMMKYDPYYAQYYYSKYRPQEEGRHVEEDEMDGDFIEKKIRNVRDNNSIFRQDGGDGTSFIQTAITLATVAMNLFAGGDGASPLGGALDIIGSLVGGGSPGGSSGTQSTSSKVDRIDTAGVDDAISTINEASGTAPTDDLDIAMGTLMAYSGKFLRQIGAWAFEHATQTSSDTFSQSAVPDKATVSAILGGGGSSSGSSVATSSVAVSSGYLQTLSQPELEKIGLKAVAAGAKPGDLQQAFVTAQTQGDWSKLETLISNALGPDAIKDPNANNPISGISNLIGNFIGGGTNTKLGNNPVSSSSDGPSVSTVVQNTAGATAQTGGILEKLSMVWSGDPTADPITQGNIATRFVSTFGLQQEALSLQSGINSILKGVNSLLGEDSTYSTDSEGNKISNKIGGVTRPGQTYSESVVEVPVKDSEASLVDSLTSIPQSLGTLAVSAIKFITPKKPAVDRISSIPSGSRPPSATVSEVRPLIDLEDPSTLALGVAGVAAITGVTFAITNALDSEAASSDEDDAESKQVPNNFERFGAEHFLTNFASKRSFDNFANRPAMPYIKKKTTRSRRSNRHNKYFVNHARPQGHLREDNFSNYLSRNW